MTILFKFMIFREGSYSTKLSSRPEESWACGPPKVMKNAVCLATSLHGSAVLPFVIPSEPGFPATQHRTRQRVRLSVRKGA
jgi:hypothetical protein